MSNTKDAGSVRITRVVANRYLVESTGASQSNTYWVDPNSLNCECPAGRRRRPCKHLRLVLDMLEGRTTA